MRINRYPSLTNTLGALYDYNVCQKYFTPEAAYNMLKEVLIETPDIVLACKIQELSKLMIRAGLYSEALISTRTKNYDEGVGNRLKELLELRTIIEGQNGYTFNFENISTTLNHTTNITEKFNAVTLFLTLLYDIGELETENYVYHTVRRLGTIVEHLRIPILRKKAGKKNRELDFSKSALLTMDDRETIFQDIATSPINVSITTEYIYSVRYLSMSHLREMIEEFS